MNCLLSDKECITILSKSLKDKKFTFIKYETQKFSESTLGYLAEHRSLTIFYKVHGESDVRNISYFVKCFPRRNTEQKKLIESIGVIRIEVNVYEKLIKKLQLFSKTPFCADFYYGRDDIIILENLRDKSFQMSSEVYFDESKIQACLRTMAVMHAASIKLEEVSRSSNSNSYYTLLDDYVEELTKWKRDFSIGTPSNKWYVNSTNCVARLCEYFTGNPRYVNQIVDFEKFHMPTLSDASTTSRNVFCHNDFWNNNIMFNDNNECRFVDFQLIKYGPPAFDFWTLLYFNTEFQYLRSNTKHFIELYFDALERELNQASIDISNIIPKDEFLETVEYYAKPALFHVCVCGTYAFVSEKFVTGMMQNKEMYEEFTFGDRTKYVLEEIKRNKLIEARFRNIILPLCEMFTP